MIKISKFVFPFVFQADNGQQLGGGEPIVRKQEQRSPLLSISEVTNTLLDH
jgi:hypothetical protein